MTDLQADSTHLRQAATPDIATTYLATARHRHAALQLGVGLGRPEHVLLVPGFTGSKEDFAPILPPLAAAGYAVTAMDQRGQYQTPGSGGVMAGDTESAEDYRVDALAQELIALVETLAGRILLVGHSFGGLVARAAVIDRPDLFDSFVLMDTGPAAVDAAQRARLDLMRPVLEQYGIEAVYQGMEYLAAQEEGYVAPAPELAELLHERFVTSSPVMLLGMGEALLSEPDRVAELAGAGLRSLVLHGADEDVWLPPVQKEMAERLGVERVIIDGAAHSPAADNPEATIAALLAFWRT